MLIDGSCKGLCVRPHGGLSVLGMSMALVSWGLSIGVHATCFFVRANDRFDTGFGVWTRENLVDGVPTPSNGYTCREYTSGETRSFDTKWNSAAALAYSAGVLGFIFMVLLIGSSCACFSRAFFKLAAFSFCVAGILDFCTLVGLDSTICANLTLSIGDPAQCVFSTGAGLAVGAGISYFITAAIVWKIPPAREYDAEEDDEEVVPAGDDEGSPPSDTGKDIEMVYNEDPTRDMDGAEPTDTEEASQKASQRRFCVAISSSLLFLLGSTFYMWLAVLDFQWAEKVLEFVNAAPKDILKWWWNAPDDDAAYDDDIVFYARFHGVSKYQILYFVAGCAFMVEGFLDFFGTPGIRGIFFIFAGTFGLASAWTAERDPSLSAIFNLVSSHLYVLEAIGLLMNRDDFTGRLRRCVLFNDICFLVATIMDVATGYTGVLRVYNMAITKADVASAALWLFCAVFYVGATVYGKRHGYLQGPRGCTSNDEHDDGSPEDEKAVSDGEVQKSAEA